MMVRPRPNMKPTWTPAAMKRDTKPIRSRPSTISTAPTSMARAAEEVGEAVRVAEGDRGHDRRRDGRRRGGGADDQLAAGAEQGVAEQPGEGGEQPGLGRQPGDLGIGDRLGDHQGPGGEGGDDVRTQPGAPVVPQPADRRHRLPLVARHGRVEVAFEVDVGVVADVEDDLDDPAAGELELGLVLAGDRVAAVVADAEALAAEAVARRDRPELVARPRPGRRRGASAARRARGARPPAPW